jgi:hypothetical protein
MNEHDVMRLLAEANPVRVESLEPLHAPESAGRTIPRPRLVLAGAVLLALVAGTAAAVFAFHSPGSRASASTSPHDGAYGVTPDPIEPIRLSEASAALGAPVVLPDTSLIGPSDIGRVTKECPGVWGRTCEIRILFFVTGAVGPTGAAGATGSGDSPASSYDPTAYGVQIRYSLGGYSDPLAEYKADARDRGSVIYVSGTPAILYLQNPRDTKGTAASAIDFQINGVSISVVSIYANDPSAQSVAQSIIDRSK